MRIPLIHFDWNKEFRLIGNFGEISYQAKTSNTPVWYPALAYYDVTLNRFADTVGLLN